MDYFKEIIPAQGSCLIIGDFNICHMKQPDYVVFTTLKSMGFNLMIQEATHCSGGHIDQVWVE